MRLTSDLQTGARHAKAEYQKYKRFTSAQADHHQSEWQQCLEELRRRNAYIPPDIAELEP
jgi:hypothetical protein